MKNNLLIITIIFFANCLIAQSIESKLQSAIDSIFEANPQSVGIMVHVESPNKNISWSGASGYADDSLKTKLTPDQPALIASSIKTYVSASILRLVETGALSIDDPIGPHLTGKTKNIFEKDGYNLHTILVKHLLSHTSGIKDYANESYIEHKDKNPMYRWTRDEQLALTISGGDPLGKPGEQFSYADANYLLLTEIIENKTGMKFFEAMRSLLKYDELGINHTWFPTLEENPGETKELVHQYWGEKNWDSYKMDVSWDLYGGGGIACPTKDLALFIHNYFNGNIVKNDSVRALIFTNIPTKETENSPYYLGLSEGSHHDMKAYGHGGFWGTVMMHFPLINTSVAVYILNRDKRILRKDVLDIVSKIMANSYSQTE